MILADYTSRRLFLAGADGKAEPPEPWIPASIGHHEEWLAAIRCRGETTCNFEYSGNLAEAVLLGNVAYRSGEKLEWDAATARATNTHAGDQYVRREYRKGWTL